MDSRSTKLAEGGKLVIPASYRREMGIEVGDTLMLSMVDGELRVRSRDAVISQIQAMVRQFVPEGVSMVDEFIADRRAEAAKE